MPISGASLKSCVLGAEPSKGGNAVAMPATLPAERDVGSDPAAVGTVRTIDVPATAHPWLVAVVADLHALPKHSVEWLSHDVVIVNWTRRSRWVFVVAIFLFPLGLAALFFTMTEHGTIAIVAEGPPATLVFGGQFSNAAVGAINAHIPA